MKKSSASNVFLPSRAASWTTEDLRMLRQLAEQGCSAQIIAARLRRTVSSVRNKGLMQGLSFGPRHTQVETIDTEPSDAQRAIVCLSSADTR